VNYSEKVHDFDLSKLKIINDLHIGVTRGAGTTPTSAAALNEYTLDTFAQLLSGDDVTTVILGDLFDKHTVDYKTLLTTYWTLDARLRNFSSPVLLVRGNHDISRDQTKLSSCDVLGTLLAQQHKNFLYITEVWESEEFSLAIIPHLPNQDLFDLAVKRAAMNDTQTLLCHANYNNSFAVEQDQSLNLTPEQSRQFEFVISGHEHLSRKSGCVNMVGSQTITNIADTDAGVVKSYGVLKPSRFTLHPVDNHPPYHEITWQELDDHAVEGFIKVVGNAAINEAGDVLHTVDSFRRKSSAYIVQVAVDFEQIDVAEATDCTTQKLTELNVMKMLYEMLSERQRELLDRVRGMNHA